MSREIDNLITLIERSIAEENGIIEDDSYVLNPDVHLAYNPSPKGIAKDLFVPGTEVLFMANGTKIDDAERFKVASNSAPVPSDVDTFSYQPYEHTKEIDREASTREQGPVYKTKDIGPRLTGKAAWDKYSSTSRTGYVTLKNGNRTLSLSIHNSSLDKASFTRKKVKYSVTYVWCSAEDEAGKRINGKAILKITKAPVYSPEESKARGDKMRTTRLSKINAEIEELEARLRELQAKKGKLEK